MSAIEHDPGLVIARRFRGPAYSGNGGYTAGMLAQRVSDAVPSPTVAVTLRRPPPLDTTMTVRRLPPGTPENPSGFEVVVLGLDDSVIASATAVEREIEPVDWVEPASASEATVHFAGLVSHPFPTCFACGTGRSDGLGIHPGRLPSGLVAATWRPDASLAESSSLDDAVSRVGPGTAWAAVDCTGGWAADLENRPMVLGQMTAELEALPVVGDDHVVVGELRGSEGRKTFTASTLYDQDRRVVARAEHVWIAVDPEVFNTLERAPS